MIPTMTPNNPIADPKISTIRILTNVAGVCASASAQLAPTAPTHTPQKRLERPTVTPEEKIAYESNNALSWSIIVEPILDCNRIAMITP